MVGRDAPEFALIGVRSDSAEERADLPFPTLEVSPQDRNLLAVIGNFDRGEPLCAPTQEQAALPLGTQVPDPLSVPAWRHEIAAALESQNIDRGAPRLARLASADFEDSRSRDAQSATREPGHHAIEHVRREPAGTLVALSDDGDSRTAAQAHDAAVPKRTAHATSRGASERPDERVRAACDVRAAGPIAA